MTNKRPTSRSARKRGPKAAPGENKASHAPLIDGGYPLVDAERHFSNYNQDGSIDSRDEDFFRATRAMVVVARRWRKLANDRIKALKQNMARWETLYLVAYSGEEPSQGELARLIGVEGPTMVHMLHALARDGLIERHQSAKDRRVTVNRITEPGRQIIRDIMGITNDLRTEMLEEIEPEKLAVTLQVLSQILEKLDDMQS